MDWRPWNVVSRGEPVLKIEEIKEPPCKCCRFFSPRAKTDILGIFDGVVICSSEKMYRDFSCYEKKKD